MNLQSKAFARILDLVSEGEIEGLVNGDKSIYLNGVPLQNADGTYNFQNVTYDTRPGTQAQTYIAGIPAVESETLVNVEVTNPTPVVRSIINADVNAVRVTVYTPALYRITSKGNRDGRSVQIAIDVQPNGGSYTTVLTDTISGVATSKYQRSYRVNLTGSAPWNIRVRRITEDSTSARIVDETFWESYTEIIDAKLRYPNSALVYMKFDASTFSGIPGRSYDLKLKKVQVPVNYDPITRVYTGAWNGTFKTEWTDNPAWCFYDLVTNSRYGLGDYIPASQIDKWGLYTIGQYCDELVPDGFGGTEPRFTCNLYLQSRAEAFKVLNDLASCFRSMVYWAGGAMTLAQDAPSDPVALFTQSNVVDGLFTYSGSSAKARHTVALVTWNDPADLYNQKVEYVEDTEGISRYGIVSTEVVAFGCTSRGQANRVGRWILYSERNETETVTLTTGVEGSGVRPGDIIKVADASRAGIRLGGRVSTATTASVTVDHPTGTLAPGSTLYVMLPDGSVESRSVGSVFGNVITVAPAFSASPAPAAQWLVSSPSVEAQTFRVLNVVEKDQGQIEITALRHEPLKYDAVEDGLVLPIRDITALTPTPSEPTSVTLSETLYTYQAEVRAKINVGWPNVQGASTYRVEWSKDGGNFVDAITSVSDYELLNITPGEYVVRVYSISAIGSESPAYATATITALGKTAPPADVTVFDYEIDPNIGATLTWTKVADLDVEVYEVRQGATWESSVLIGQVKGSTLKIGLLPSGTTTYQIKALDTSENYSLAAASTTVVITAAGEPTPLSHSFAGENVVLRWTDVEGTLATQAYEIRYGASWAAGTSIGTIKGTSFAVKAQWQGVRKFWVAAIDISGNVGTAGSVDVTISAPVSVTMSQEVIDNNVLLKWGDATATLPVDFYELRRGSTWAGATVIGRVSARFSAIFETSAGLFTYWVRGYDLAGNEGAASSVTAQVNQPPDYTLQYNQNSAFSGTLTNVAIDTDGSRLAPVSTTETWQTHFTSRSWTTPQDQINAGYPIYAQPSQATGSYEETIDYGTVLAATKITATLTYNVVSGTTTVTPTISVKKLVGDPWTDYAGQSSVFVTDFRYVKVRYDFGSTGGDDLIDITSLNVRFDVKLKNDAGTVSVFPSQSATYSQTGTTITVTFTAHGRVTGQRVDMDFTSGTAADGEYVITSHTANTFTVTAASATTSGNVTLDPTGTPLLFAVTFVDVQSITLSPAGTAARIAVYNFVDAPNPTGFKVLLYDTAGTRVAGTVGWNAKGV